MFDIDNKYSTFTTTPLIVRNKVVFHHDEFPILFAGFNKYGNKIVGSFITEDDNDIQYYFHLHVSDKNYHDFLDRKISYPELMQKSDIYVVALDVNGTVKNTWCIKFTDIPKSHVPMEMYMTLNWHSLFGK